MEKLLMIRFASLFIFLISLSIASTDYRGHNRLIGTYSELNDFLFREVVINHRSEILLNKGKHSFEAAYEVFLQKQTYHSIFPIRMSRFDHRIDDLNLYMIQDDEKENKLLLLQNLDRFFYTYSSAKWDVYLGRQSISFGPSRFVNPLDILVPFNLTMINLEQRLGVDGLRAKYSLSEMKQIEFGQVFDKERSFKNEFKFLSYRGRLKTIDYSLLYQQLESINVYGVALQYSIYNWGGWTEYAYFSDANLNKYRVTTGGQYHFENNVDITIEYYKNNLGVNDKIPTVLQGENYLMGLLSYMLTPLKTIGVGLFSDLDKGSQLLNLTYDHNLDQDWYFQLGSYFVITRNNGDFANYPQTFYLSLKNFF